MHTASGRLKLTEGAVDENEPLLSKDAAAALLAEMGIHLSHQGMDRLFAKRGFPRYKVMRRHYTTKSELIRFIKADCKD